MFDHKKYKEIEEYISKNNKLSKIVAISKNHPKTSVLEAIAAGVRVFGENRVQEAEIKFAELLKKYSDISLHLTGPLQTNKVKQALDIFSVFHTLDREKLVNEFSKYPDMLASKEFFIQVNIGKEETKSGVHPENLNDFYIYCKNKKQLNIIGLMCIPPISEDSNFHFDLLKKMGRKIGLNRFSMGMSNDYKEAINLDSTYIRLGTVLFGQREKL